MVRRLLALGVVIVFLGNLVPSGPERPGARPFLVSETDPKRAKPLGRWPGDADLARLKSVEGRSKAVVLHVLGHPSRVTRRPNGEEVWDYAWCATCCVWLRNGICTDTFYTAGY